MALEIADNLLARLHPTAAEDRLGAISQSFATRAKNLSDTPELLWAVGVTAAVLLLIMLAVYWHRRKKKYIPHGWITDPKIINMVLNMAIDQRSTFELQFYSEADRRRPILRCSPLNLKNGELVLEAYGVQNIAEEWPERELEIYFKISSEGQYIYYAVRAKIKEIKTSGNERVLLTLYSFDKLENRQKRAFLRISPPEEYMLGAAVWYNKLPDAEVFTDATLWPTPDLVLLPGKKQQFTILDISSGGGRLKVPRIEMQNWETRFGIGETVYFLLNLMDPDERKRLRFWLQCRVQNISVEYDTHDVDVGLQFVAWATIKEGSSTTLEWLKLARNLEVGAIGNWVIRRHLELFREKPGER